MGSWCSSHYRGFVLNQSLGALPSDHQVLSVFVFNLTEFWDP